MLVDIGGIIGSACAAFLLGGAAGNILAGLAGDDLLSGQEGGDALHGGPGHEQLRPGTGADFLSGGADNGQFPLLREDLVFGRRKFIEDFSEGGANGFGFLGLGGLTGRDLTIADNGGPRVITTTSPNLTGGIAIRDVSGEQTLDRRPFF